MSETTTGFTPTEQDVEQAADAIADIGHDVTDRLMQGWSVQIARVALATIGPIIERERRTAKVEALREAAERINAVCPYGEGDVPYANDIHLEMWADEIERASHTEATR